MGDQEMKRIRAATVRERSVDARIGMGDKNMRHARKTRIVPAFATEAQEAAWWYKNRAKLDRDLLEAARTGELKGLDRKTLTARAGRSKAAKVVSIRLPESDLELARLQAARKGLPYQTYIKSLLHQALEQQSKAR